MSNKSLESNADLYLGFKYFLIKENVEIVNISAMPVWSMICGCAGTCIKIYLEIKFTADM